MIRRLLLLSFIEGAAVMVAELCGAKLLAPIYGGSLFVWASVIGVTLSALASGYFFGGLLSARDEETSMWLFRVLGLASIFMMAMPVLSYYLVPRISYLPFLPGIVLSTICLIFLPLFFMGATSPLLISIQTKTSASAGRVSGSVYAVSTLGGILATFLCGFFFIPALGLDVCLILFGIILFMSNFIVMKIFSGLQLIFFVLFAYLNLQFKLHPPLTIYTSDSVLGHLEVKNLMYKKDSVRVLKINDIVQSEMSLTNHRSVSDYVKVLDSLVGYASQGDRAAVLGLGAGLTASDLYRKGFVVDGVEFDQRIIACAKEYFQLPPAVKTIEGDARVFLNRATSKYKVLMFDLYRAEEQPSHVITSESLVKIKSLLSEKGFIVISWHGYLHGNIGRGSRILLNTLKKAGLEVKVCASPGEEGARNLIFVAAKAFEGNLPFELQDEMEKEELVNSDHRPVLERYNAEANKAWRTNYLRYYQGVGTIE